MFESVLSVRAPAVFEGLLSVTAPAVSESVLSLRAPAVFEGLLPVRAPALSKGLRLSIAIHQVICNTVKVVVATMHAIKAARKSGSKTPFDMI